MPFSRRAFLRCFGIGLAAAAALIGCDAATLEVLSLGESGKYAAGQYLVKRWREHMRSGAGVPDKILVSAGLYDAYEAGLSTMYRMVETASLHDKRPGLMFRSAALRADETITTWEGLRFVS